MVDTALRGTREVLGERTPTRVSMPRVMWHVSGPPVFVRHSVDTVLHAWTRRLGARGRCWVGERPRVCP